MHKTMAAVVIAVILMIAALQGCDDDDTGIHSTGNNTIILYPTESAPGYMEEGQ